MRDDYIEARRLLSSVLDAPPTAGYQHDHDEEFGTWDDHASPNMPNVASVTKALLNHSRLRPRTYWVETASLVMEYFVLQAGPDYNDTLRQGFIAWLKRSPGNRRQYEEGGDMKRAALVDWFLRLVR